MPCGQDPRCLPKARACGVLVIRMIGIIRTRVASRSCICHVYHSVGTYQGPSDPLQTRPRRSQLTFYYSLVPKKPVARAIDPIPGKARVSAFSVLGTISPEIPPKGIPRISPQESPESPVSIHRGPVHTVSAHRAAGACTQFMASLRVRSASTIMPCFSLAQPALLHPRRILRVFQIHKRMESRFYLHIATAVQARLPLLQAHVRRRPCLQSGRRCKTLYPWILPRWCCPCTSRRRRKNCAARRAQTTR